MSLYPDYQENARDLYIDIDFFSIGLFMSYSNLNINHQLMLLLHRLILVVLPLIAPYKFSIIHNKLIIETSSSF